MAYKVLNPIEYAGKRAETGDIVNDIPAKSVPWLLDQGIIEATEGKKEQPKPAKREPVSNIEGDK
jgi:hypothetical protein